MTVQFLECQSSNLQVGSLSALLGKMTTRYVAKIRRRHILHNHTHARYRCGNSNCIGCWLWMKMVDIECKPCAGLWHRGLAGEVAPRTTLAAFHSRASGNTAALLCSGKTLFSLLRALLHLLKVHLLRSRNRKFVFLHVGCGCNMRHGYWHWRAHNHTSFNHTPPMVAVDSMAMGCRGLTGCGLSGLAGWCWNTPSFWSGHSGMLGRFGWPLRCAHPIYVMFPDFWILGWVSNCQCKA